MHEVGTLVIDERQQLARVDIAGHDAGRRVVVTENVADLVEQNAE